MAKCPVPHNSLQRRSNFPARVGVNQIYVTRPGTRSILARNCGTAKSCRTSMERSSALTGLPTGRCSSGLDTKTSSCPLESSGFIPNGFLSLTYLASTVPITPSFPGKRKPQFHCLPTASNTAAFAGTSTNFAHTNKPGANMAARSEERRVGKESSFEWSHDEAIKKERSAGIESMVTAERHRNE